MNVKIQIEDRENRILSEKEATRVIKNLELSFDNNCLSLIINKQTEKSFLKFCLENIKMVKERLHQHGYKVITFEESPNTAE